MEVKDGLCSDFFTYLWEVKKGERQNVKYSFYIPDTVVYRCKEPVTWFLSTKDMEFVKKKDINSGIQQIKSSFLDREPKSGVYACFIYYDKETKQTNVQYFDKDGLTYFFNHKNDRQDEGILQKFVNPPYDQNS